MIIDESNKFVHGFVHWSRVIQEMEVTPTIPATTTSTQTKKVATHSHIRGLGLKEDGTAEPISAGFVGQLKAREVSTFALNVLPFLL